MIDPNPIEVVIASVALLTSVVTLVTAIVALLAAAAFRSKL